jgi:hypothetical protein
MNHHSMQLRCLIERDHELYVGYCLDLGLGVQGDSAAEVREALHAAIDAYLQRVTEIARAGDATGALRLLRRRAPWGLRIKYWLVWLLTRWSRLSERRTRLWAERHPDPRACCQ